MLKYSTVSAVGTTINKKLELNKKKGKQAFRKRQLLLLVREAFDFFV